MKKLTIGKIRGLQQITNADGLFTICAIDHRGSLINMLGKGNPGSVDYKTIVQCKMELCQALAPFSSAILLDPIYGAHEAIARNILPGKTGLLVSTEATGYLPKGEGALTELQAGWTIAKIKRMGGSAAKLLLYYRPDLADAVPLQLATALKVAKACQRSDLPFLLETVAYTIKGEKVDSPQFAAKKAGLVIETARQISKLPIDVFKAEFPADLRYERDDGKLVELCRQVDKASPNPWVLLSAGVNYETYAKQVEFACRGGASGIAAGRAIWQEGVTIPDAKERIKYLNTVVADRLKRLGDIVAKYANPWYKKLNLKPQQLTEVTGDWYENY
ncbi:MAG: hypothetical protein HW384_232 [Dehalococcoidia bacterium]|nr:hypothetical protein [Dehalococcoidia bacterium]